MLERVHVPGVGHKRSFQSQLQTTGQLHRHKTKYCITHSFKLFTHVLEITTGLTWSSRVTSDVRTLSVFHFWFKLKPRSFTLYLVSRFPAAFPVSVLLEPPVENSWETRGKHRRWKDAEKERKNNRERDAELWERGRGGIHRLTGIEERIGGVYI